MIHERTENNSNALMRDDGEGDGREEEVDFDRYLDMEDRKVLNKRKKRGNKVEECNLDIETFITQKKR